MNGNISYQNPLTINLTLLTTNLDAVNRNLYRPL